MSKKIACIGVGAMGGAIMRSICKKENPSNIFISDKNENLASSFAQETNCKYIKENTECVSFADYILLAVKPQFLKSVIDEIKPFIKKSSVVISMAAGVKTSTIVEWAPELRVVRMMPNVCAQVEKGIIGVSMNSNISDSETSDILGILSSAGIVEIIPESLMDCVTAVSGSGPAFVFSFIEAMADAAVKCGMPRSQAYTFAAQTVYGSAAMVLETKEHPAVLKDKVCSPAGTTIEGIAALEANGFRNAIIEAVSAAYNKSISIGKK